MGTLAAVRAQYEEKGNVAAGAGELEGMGPSGGPGVAILAVVEQLKPILGLMPEVTTKPSKDRPTNVCHTGPVALPVAGCYRVQLLARGVPERPVPADGPQWGATACNCWHAACC